MQNSYVFCMSFIIIVLKDVETILTGITFTSCYIPVCLCCGGIVIYELVIY